MKRTAERSFESCLVQSVGVLVMHSKILAGQCPLDYLAARLLKELVLILIVQRQILDRQGEHCQPTRAIIVRGEGE
jgi:hypothetical protein